jgi:predicted MPP superfamily phosphohydrolase
VDLLLKRLPAAWHGTRIVQLSDFHYDPYFSVHPVRKGVEIVRALHPDLIVFTGDFITDHGNAPFVGRKQQLQNLDACAALLGSLQCRLGSVAVLGNHDVGFDADAVMSALQAHGVPVLRNASHPLEQNGSRLWLVGVDDVLAGSPDLEKALTGVPKDEPVILLAHEPDFALQSVRYGVDLQLSGHSHGGQIRIPLLGPIYLPELAHKFPKGFYRVGDMQLYTNVGLGTINVPLRFDCRPEVTVFTLRSGV